MPISSGRRSCADFPIELVESSEGSLADLAAFLNGQGLAAALQDGQSPADASLAAPRLRLIELGASRTAAWLAGEVRAGRAAGPTLAIVHSANSTDLSKALAAGCDDVLVAPIEPEDLLNRLDAAATLARLRGELARRHRALAEFGNPPPRDYLNPGLPKPRTLIVGPASQAQVRIIEMLGDTPTAFADTAAQASRLLLAEPFDLVIFSVTDRRSCSDATSWPVQEVDGPTTLLFTAADHAVPAGAPIRFDDRLTIEQPAESLCMRLQFWRQVAGHRRALRQGPAPALAELTVDSLTGLANHGFLFAYADQCRSGHDATPRAVLLARLANLRDINRQAGFPQGNCALRRMGLVLRRHLRAGDLLGHLGAGQFAAILGGVGRDDLAAIIQRIETSLDAEAPTNDAWSLRAQLRGGLVDRGEPLPDALERIIANASRTNRHAA